MNTDHRPPQPRACALKRMLGRSSVPVSALGLGGGGLGNLYRALPHEEAIATVRRALDEGIDFFDTAPFYGFGLSERRIGEALCAHPRHAVTLSTKVGRTLFAIERDDVRVPRHSFYSSEPYEPRFDYSYDGVLRSCESSLRRLRTDYIDVLLCHDIGALTHGQEHEPRLQEFMQGGYRAMQRLRDEGTVRAIGIGVNECEVCSSLLPRCDFDCVLLAGRYTLLEQGALTELFPLCAERQVSIIVGGPFNSGILASRPSDADAHYNYEKAPVQIRERVQRIERICARFGVPMPAAALQFPLAHPQVASVIPGCSSADEVHHAAQWMTTSIPSELWKALRSEALLHIDAPVPS